VEKEEFNTANFSKSVIYANKRSFGQFILIRGIIFLCIKVYTPNCFVMKTNLKIWVAAAMISSPGTAVFCQETPQTDIADAKAATKSVMIQADFVSEVAALSILEVELGKIALKKAVSTKVQEFAKMMIDDHTNVKTDLSTLATSKKTTLPKGMPERYQNQVTALAAKSGQDFDRDYLAFVLTEHKKAVELIKNASENAKDADVKAFAIKALPRMLYHLEMAERLEKADTN
jgi:putative membrane protein